MALLDFEIGDRVFDLLYGWGKIDVIYLKDNLLRVNFDCKVKRSYNLNGETADGYPRPVLSFTEYKLDGFSQEKPEELPKPGDIVWVRDREYDNWMITYFRKYSKDKELKYGTNPRNSGDSNDIYFYRFLTTKNPYEK